MTGKVQNNTIGAQNPIEPAANTPGQIESSKEFFCAKGDILMQKNEYRLALKEYLVSIMMDKSNVNAFMGASKAYKKLKEYDKAIKHLKCARNVFSFDPEIYYELGLNYLLKDNNEKAMKNFIRTIKLKPDNKNAQIKLALAHELEGEDDMAILVYKTIIEKNPDYIPAYSALANLYVEGGEFALALALFQKIVKINKDYYRAYLGIGLCFDELGKYVNAVRYYKKYITYKPYSTTSKSLAARIYHIYKYKLRTNTNTDSRANLKIVTS